MAETVVHVTTLDQWKSVLDVWFKQGYEWFSSGNTYAEKTFEQGGANQLGLVDYGFKYIVCWINNDYDGDNLIEYKQFMAQQKEDNKMETYYVKQEQFDLIEELKEREYPLHTLLTSSGRYKNIKVELSSQEEKALLRYLGGDKTVEFKVKEPLYRLYLVDVRGQRNYFTISNATALPDRTVVKEKAFVETLEEIKKWQTPAWDIEKAD
ncbi:hypothetical protein EFN46_10780 [Leuconostoc pseudomesenteroides]|uniref:hypothetical protein n=1 Tax=Leuconostoc pseudomesenteroides TaxID=33968 RepID=UPI0021AA6C2A|nr:hypothetical protein [Leuconostoc pseudomesenteroides]MCT4388678.1 hypothetical protein [Leuconostoc pseudomesenteroides]